MTARSLFCLALILACTEINAWHAKFFPRLRSATVQQFSTQSKNFLSSNGKFNLLKTKSNSLLKFKVSESEEEADVDDEVIEFDDIGGSGRELAAVARSARRWIGRGSSIADVLVGDRQHSVEGQSPRQRPRLADHLESAHFRSRGEIG